MFLQIFPVPDEVVLGPETTLNNLDHDHEKERLPSIVVEPTELSEVESGELRWPPENMEMEEDEEDLFLEQCIPPANIADWGEEEDEEETSVILNQQPGLTLIGELDMFSYALLYTSSYAEDDFLIVITGRALTPTLTPTSTVQTITFIMSP